MSEAVVAQKGPYAVAIRAAKKYYWCACGRSAKQPFCDGSHKGTGFSPIEFSVEEGKTVHFCGCKRSGGKPLCDGTHSRL